jgi:uncharacterized membrane protein
MEEIATPAVTSQPFDFLNRLNPQAVFLLVAGFFGVAFALIVPPVQGPDEPVHWFRMYQLGEGKLLSPTFGDQMPTSMVDYGRNIFAAISFNPLGKVKPHDILDQFNRPLNPEATEYVFFPTTLYSILPYAPQTLTMLIARKLGWPAIGLLYAGRIGTVLGYLLIGWAAIRITPILKWPACMILLSPMAMFLSGTLSADPLSTAMVFLATAVALRCILLPVPLTTGSIVSLALVMIGVALCKPAYFPVAFLVFAIPPAKWGGGYRRWILPISIILLTVATFSTWSVLTHADQIKERGMPGPAVMQPLILHHPKEFAQVIYQTIVQMGPDIVESSVSHLGWVDTFLLPCAVDFIFIALIWICLAYDEPINLQLWPRTVAAGAALGCVLLILTFNYMVWDNFSKQTVEGTQGRYFLPVGILLCMIIRRRGRYPAQPKWMLALFSAIATYTLWVVIERYYLPPGIIAKVLSAARV